MSGAPIRLGSEGRFARLEAIEWWDQARLGEARVLVVGAGALGNEVIKNLSLLGLGHLVVVDRDRVELSNLSRSVLFREADEGRPKAECAVRAARDLFPGLRAQAIVADVISGVGLGLFRWADVVVGALDNREARVFLNAACARVGRPWVDGGIEVQQGIVRAFAPPATACYECTMSRIDWQLIDQRRSCSLLARRAIAARGTPTTPTTASVIGGMQAHEVVKLLHGLESLLGRAFVFEGLTHSSYAVAYARKPECPWHEPATPVDPAQALGSQATLGAVWGWAAQRLGGVEALDFAREIVAALDCPSCGSSESVLAPVESVAADKVACPECAAERTPRFVHSVGLGSPLLSRSVQAVGLPPWDIIWARRGSHALGVELAQDGALVLGAAGQGGEREQTR